MIIDLAAQAADDGYTFISVENATGSAYNDTFFGSAIGNVLEGGRGADKLYGFDGADTYVFHAGFSNDEIFTFIAGNGTQDRIQFDATLFANFAAVQDATTQAGSDAVITLDSDHTVTLRNVLATNLHDSDFAFV